MRWGGPKAGLSDFLLVELSVSWKAERKAQHSAAHLGGPSVAQMARKSADWMDDCSVERLAVRRVLKTAEQMASQWAACSDGPTVDLLAMLTVVLWGYQLVDH